MFLCHYWKANNNYAGAPVELVKASTIGRGTCIGLKFYSFTHATFSPPQHNKSSSHQTSWAKNKLAAPSHVSSTLKIKTLLILTSYRYCTDNLLTANAIANYSLTRRTLQPIASSHSLRQHSIYFI
jgi:hypothetical protein